MPPAWSRPRGACAGGGPRARRPIGVTGAARWRLAGVWVEVGAPLQSRIVSMTVVAPAEPAVQATTAPPDKGFDSA